MNGRDVLFRRGELLFPLQVAYTRAEWPFTAVVIHATTTTAESPRCLSVFNSLQSLSFFLSLVQLSNRNKSLSVRLRSLISIPLFDSFAQLLLCLYAGE